MPSPPRVYRLTPRPARPARPRPERHLIEDIRYSAEWIRCTCGTEINAEPDPVFPSRHEPLVVAWAEHRRAAGLRVLSVAEAAMNHRGFS